MNGTAKNFLMVLDKMDSQGLKWIIMDENGWKWIKLGEMEPAPAQASG